MPKHRRAGAINPIPALPRSQSVLSRAVIEIVEQRILLTAGEPDFRFGSDGHVLSPSMSDIGVEDSALQPDQRVLVSGYQVDGSDGSYHPFLARYNTDGTLDAALQANAQAAIGGLGLGSSNAVAVQPDGRILVEVNPAIIPGDTLARLLPDGTLDPSFGNEGITSTFGPIDDLTVLSDGRIAIASDSFVEWLNSDGTFNSALDVAGVFQELYVRHITALRDNSILIADESRLLRITAAGTIDTSFATGGVFDAGEDFDAVGSAIATSDGIFVPGHTAILSLTPSGQANLSFGPAGMRMLGLDPQSENANGMSVQPDGAFLVVGDSSDHMFMLRLKPDGTRDPLFGNNGEVDAEFITGETFDSALASYWTAAGLMLVGQMNGRVALARYMDLSTGLSADGTLVVAGSPGADSITISAVGTNVNAIVNGVMTSAPKSGVKRILVCGFGGNDIIRASDAPIGCTLYGGHGNDSITGSRFGDTLLGGAGDDLLDGGLGADLIRGDDGNDTADYSRRTHPLVITVGKEWNDGEVNERDNVDGDVETVLGGSGADRITGNGLNNLLRGGGGNDTLNGGWGNDTLDGGAGADDLWGGPGIDAVDYSSRTAPLFIKLGDLGGDGEAGENDYIHADIGQVFGGAGNDLIIGNSFANLLRGGAGNDTLLGMDGNDTLDGGAGTDSLSGGAGRDTADYSSHTAAVTLSLDGVANDGAPGENDYIAGDIENLTGGSGNDRIIGNSASNVLSGGAGNDSIIAGLGDDTLDAGTGADVLDYSARVTPLEIQMSYQGGTISSGTETDSIVAPFENVSIRSGSGDDHIVINDFAYVRPSAPADLVVSGGAGNDSFEVYGDGDGISSLLQGDDGNDTIHTGNDVDPTLVTVYGGNGDDFLKTELDIPLHGGPGTDTIEVTQLNLIDLRTTPDTENAIAGFQGGTIYGNDAANKLGYFLDPEQNVPPGTGLTVYGGAGDDTLYGSPEGDSLVGGAGDDVIEGDLGPDTLEGDAGDDLFTNRNPDLINQISDADLVDGGDGTDFYQGDSLDTFKNVEFNYDPEPAAPQTPAAASSSLNIPDPIRAAATTTAASPPTVTLAAGTLTINGTPGNDTIQVTQNAASLNVTINKKAMGSFALSAVTLLSISAGDGNDIVILRNSTGTQAVTKSSIINGNAGNDTLTGGDGNDVFLCNSSRDGNDVMIGGKGDDKVDYSRRSAPLNISLDGVANDGDIAGGERDNVSPDIETVFGGSGNDTISGGTGNDNICGGFGADLVLGNDGNDYLVGSNGPDSVWGGKGTDVIILTDGDIDHYRFGPPNELDVAHFDAVDVFEQG